MNPAQQLDGPGAVHGFLLSNGVFTSIDYPGAGSTEAWRINDQHVILGRYKGTTDAKWHLYLLNAGIFTPVADFPGAAEIAPDGYAHVGGLNLQGDIVSTYCLASCNNPATAVLHGYLLSGGAYTTIDPPGALFTMAFGINSSDEIVGVYEDATGTFHGFMRTP